MKISWIWQILLRFLFSPNSCKANSQFQPAGNLMNVLQNSKLAISPTWKQFNRKSKWWSQHNWVNFLTSLYCFFGGHFGGFSGLHLFYWHLFSATTDKRWKKYLLRYFKKIIVFNPTHIITFGILGTFNQGQGHLEIMRIASVYFILII